MPRPQRSHWVLRTYARRRHRHWMLSMTLASLGWGVWWIVLLLRRLDPEHLPSLVLVDTVSCAFAIVGLGVAILTLRAQRAWFFFALIPIMANGSLLFLPWLAGELLAGK